MSEPSGPVPAAAVGACEMAREYFRQRFDRPDDTYASSVGRYLFKWVADLRINAPASWALICGLQYRGRHADGTELWERAP